MSVIKVEDLTKVYQVYHKQEGMKGSIANIFHRETIDKVAVHSLNFEVEKGDIVGFVGLNGAGKTTTLKMLSGILKPTSGKAEVLGYNPFQKKREFLKQITMVMGSKTQLWWDLPAIESFELNRKIYDVDKAAFKNVLEELVAKLKVEKLLHVQVRKLSLGERMKMELIAALIHSPSVLFLDEPTIGLDILSQETIRTFLREYNEKFHTTIMLTSHNFDDISTLCNRLLLINKGKTFYNDTYEKFVEQYGDEKKCTYLFKNPISESDVEQFHMKNYMIEQDGRCLKMNSKEEDIVELSRQMMSLFAENIKDITIENLELSDIIKKFYE